MHRRKKYIYDIVTSRVNVDLILLHNLQKLFLMYKIIGKYI